MFRPVLGQEDTMQLFWVELRMCGAARVDYSAQNGENLFVLDRQNRLYLLNACICSSDC